MSACGVRGALYLISNLFSKRFLIRALQLRRSDPSNALMQGLGISGLVVFKLNLFGLNLFFILFAIE